MDGNLVYTRKLQPGETAPANPPGNAVPLLMDSSGRLLVAIEAVSVSVPGGVEISNPVGPAGGVQVETIPGAPLAVEFPAAQEVKVTDPIRPGGGVQVETDPASPLSVNTTHSMAQFDRAATAFAAAPGHSMILQFSGYVSPNDRRLVLPVNNLFPVSSIMDIQGNPYPILLTAQNFSASADVLTPLIWNESV